MYTFGQFTLRPATFYDMPLAQLWTGRDLDHYKSTPATFWIEQSSEINSFLLLSQDGDPVFFFRIEERPDKQAEIHIQFSGADALRQRLTRRGVTQGLHWLEKMLTESGFEGYYFHSRNPQLIFFCQQHLGFEWDGTRLYRDFRRSDAQAECEKTQRVAG